MSRFDNILHTIGRTPVVRINKLAPPHVRLYAKLEAFNPMGSVKDRLALGVIEDAERRGLLKPGQTVIEATSGNTGIGLAMVCAQKAYPLVVVMAENFSIERRKLMRFLGAKVILTPASEMGSGMLAKAQELAQKHGWFLCRQFENEANPDIHSRTTAQEILEDFADEPLDYWICGFGTSGTLKGVARVLKDKSPRTRVIVCEPDNSPMLSSGLRQDYSADGKPVSHPGFRPHLMQGWAPDFIPRLTQDVLDAGHIDAIVPIAGAEALRLARELALREGIFTGITGGATFAGALQVAQEAPPGSTLLCLLPDTGERYLSTPLFADIAVDMTDEEIALSQSTPSCRFDTTGSAADTVEISASADITALVDRIINDPAQPVVMFALEWCEFCWSVRKLFAHCAVPYRSVDLDSVEHQQDDRGGMIKAALIARTGCLTIPQIFVGGRFIGGATETLDAYKSGDLQAMLQEQGVEFRDDPALDPYRFFPGWLQKR